MKYESHRLLIWSIAVLLVLTGLALVILVPGLAPIQGQS